MQIAEPAGRGTKGQWKTLIGVLATQDSRNKNEELAQALALFYEKYGKPQRGKPANRFHFLFTGGTFDRLVLAHDPLLPASAAVRTRKREIRAALSQEWEWPKARQQRQQQPWQSWDPYDAGCLLPRTADSLDEPITFERNSPEREEFFIFLQQNSTALPRFRDGGVTLLAHLVVRRACSIIWPFLSPNDTHWLNPDNLALMRLCDHFRGKRLMNFGSVRAWLEDEAKDDRTRNPQRVEESKIGSVTFAPSEAKEARPSVPRTNHELYPQYRMLRLEGSRQAQSATGSPGKETIALIAHDQMKTQMASFALDYEAELERRFTRILATGTTGKLVQETAPSLEDRVIPLHSGPKGGDIEIAVEILAGRCQHVVFFVDPLHPHPHIDDVRVVFGACMRTPAVQIFTNEAHAREWVERVLRRRP